MALITLPFTVTGQQLELSQPVLAEHAVGSIGASFAFSYEWATLTTRTATFATIDAAYDVALVSDACTVPSEVLVASSFRVSVRGSDGANVLTTTIVRVGVASSLIGGETPAAPTPSVYDQLVAQATAAATDAAQAQSAATAAQASATASASSAADSANSADSAATSASSAAAIVVASQTSVYGEAIIDNCFPEYEYLTMETSTDADKGYYAPQWPSVGATLKFNATAGNDYLVFRFDVSSYIGKTVLVPYHYISWVQGCMLVDTDYVVLAAAPALSADGYSMWNVAIPAGAKWLITNSIGYGFLPNGKISQVAKRQLSNPMLLKGYTSRTRGNTYEFVDIDSAADFDGVYAVFGATGTHIDFYNASDFSVAIYKIRAGEKWHIYGADSYNAPLYIVASSACLHTDADSAQSSSVSNHDVIIDISADGYLIVNVGSMNNGVAKRAEYFYSDKSSISGKKVSVCGDSIMAGAHGTAVARLLRNDYDMIGENLSVCGATMAALSESTNSHIVEQVTTISADTDVIILEGGVNDFWSAASTTNGKILFGTYVGCSDTTTELNIQTFCGALETSLRWIRDNRPNIPVIYVLNHHIKDADYGANADNHTFQDFRDVVIKASSDYGFALARVDMTAFNTTTNVHNYSTYSDDGCHPTDAGYRKWYLPEIVNAIQRAFG